jgi:hypothetical protein
MAAWRHGGMATWLHGRALGFDPAPGWAGTGRVTRRADGSGSGGLGVGAWPADAGRLAPQGPRQGPRTGAAPEAGRAVCSDCRVQGGDGSWGGKEGWGLALLLPPWCAARGARARAQVGGAGGRHCGGCVLGLRRGNCKLAVSCPLQVCRCFPFQACRCFPLQPCR